MMGYEGEEGRALAQIYESVPTDELLGWGSTGRGRR